MIHGPIDDEKKSNDFCCFRCVVEQWALTVIKFVSFFVLIFAVFLPNFIFGTTVAQTDPSFIHTVHALDLYTP